ncbi:PREDICTED: non-specific lipid-transfer protein-like protein At5g64080 [Ipomoea nil]|uniref:non-specific lipid-transfer protein-like protein At5g64080 n=1 Tax=Ipomoea nil TaxID=35883 RepID=UPI000901BEAF|nr:PREDICTED: non-specific lipid-transfer protein-like protein At5g64080 [Ipomoea nil]
MVIRRLIPAALAIGFVVFVLGVDGQISTACSASMLQSFTPCLSFLTNGGGASSSPTSTCCQSLKYLMSNGTDCLCLIVTGNVPFRVPINRTLAISLPKACRNSGVSGVPVQCKASAAPLPAPGPAALGPTSSPLPTSPSPRGGSGLPLPFTPTLPPPPPVEDNVPTGGLTPSTPTDNSNSGFPTSSPGFKPDLTPDAAPPSINLSFSLLLAALGASLLKFY